MAISARLNSTAARVLALTMAGFTSAFVLFAPGSLASKVAGHSHASEHINTIILAICVLGWADVIWHDVRGKLIWPTLSRRVRHHVCVGTYSALAGLTGVRAFVAAGSNAWELVFLGAYYVICAIGIGLIAVALALDGQHGSH
jgi:hypothetical protein